MLIKFGGLVQASRGSYTGYNVTGTKVDGGGDYSTFVFDRNKGLVNKLRTCEVGTVVNLIMEQNGKYWNLKDVEPADAPSTGTGTGAAPTERQARTGGGSGSGQYRNPEDQNHSAALMAGMKMLEIMLEHKLVKVTEDLAVAKILDYSTVAYGFIKGGAADRLEAMAPAADPADALSPSEDDVMKYHTPK